MRILLFTPLTHRQDYFGDPSEHEGQVPELPELVQQHYWVRAFRKMGHEVRVVRYTDSQLVDDRLLARLTTALSGLTAGGYGIARELRRSIPSSLDPGLRARNEHFVSVVDEFDPELVMVVAGHPLFESTLEHIKSRTDATVVGMDGTDPFLFGTPSERRLASKYFDGMFTTEAYGRHAWRALGVSSTVLPTSACALPLFEGSRKERDEYEADVSFVGRVYPRRVQFLRELTDFDLAIYGPGWKRTPLAEYHRGSAWGEHMVQAVHSSKISVNIHLRSYMSGGNLKLFEIPGAKTFQLADGYDPEWYEEGEEIVSFDTPDDLREKIAYYLEHDDERERIAANGFDRVTSDHTYEDRMERLVEFVENDEFETVVDPDHLWEYGDLSHMRPYFTPLEYRRRQVERVLDDGR